MQNTMALDFSTLDVDSFLFGAIPVRFQDTSSEDFLHFIAHLFQENGYVLKQTEFSKDFGADLIVMNEGVKTAVKVKRYHEVHKVGLADLQQIIDAQEYYNCQQAMVITTSSFAAATRELAAENEAILWDWKVLLQGIVDTFFSGMDYYAYFKQYPGPTSLENQKLRFRILDFNFNSSSSSESYSVVNVELINGNENAIRVHCDLPIYITKDRKQYSAINWADDSFVNGVIHPEVAVTLTFRFSGRQVSKYHAEDRLILIFHIMPRSESIMLEQKMGTIRRPNFFVRMLTWPF